MHYFAFVQRDGAGEYLATLPDLPGCTARAPSWLRLERAIREAVREHVEQRGLAAPPPTPIECFDEDSAPAGSCWMQVRLFAHELQPGPHGMRRRMAPPSPSLADRSRMPPGLAAAAP